MGLMATKKKVCEGERIIVYARGKWEFVERKKGKEAVAIVAVTTDRKLVLTEQVRKPVDASVIDRPAGLVGDESNDDAEETARKELEEETGFACRRVALLARGPSSPGITSEIVSFYRAISPRRKGKGGGIGTEKITVHEIPLGSIEAWLKKQQKSGKMVDLKVWGALYFVTRA